MSQGEPKGLMKTVTDEGDARPSRSRGVFTFLTGANAGRVLSIPKEALVTFGRSSDCTFRFEDGSLSRIHGHLLRVRDTFVYHDPGSTNGSFINDVRVEGRVQLRDGDRLQLGKETLLRFSLVDEREEQALVQVYEAVVRDPLTGVHNRKALEDRIEAELGRAARASQNLALVILDLDFFKRINDTYGHVGGDAVLRSAGAILSSSVSPSDFVGRYGGEEFVIIGPGRDGANGVALAEHLRARLAEAPTAFEGQWIQVTASAGVAELGCCGPIRDRTTLLAAADRRLYQAKQSGRNRVVGP